jgi:hypothetical protein
MLSSLVDRYKELLLCAVRIAARGFKRWRRYPAYIMHHYYTIVCLIVCQNHNCFQKMKMMSKASQVSVTRQ